MWSLKTKIYISIDLTRKEFDINILERCNQAWKSATLGKKIRHKKSPNQSFTIMWFKG